MRRNSSDARTRSRAEAEDGALCIRAGLLLIEVGWTGHLFTVDRLSPISYMVTVDL